MIPCYDYPFHGMHTMGNARSISGITPFNYENLLSPKALRHESGTDITFLAS